jgi:ABC-type uncharacterized transport system substrate-binding protein
MMCGTLFRGGHAASTKSASRTQMDGTILRRRSQNESTVQNAQAAIKPSQFRLLWGHSRRLQTTEPEPAMHLDTRTTIAASAVALVLLATGPASVHPHVFAEARLDVMLAPDHASVASLRHLWRFDDLFSSTVLMEFDKNTDLKLDDTELQDVSKTVFDSIGEYGYFQLVTVDGKDVKMKPPADLIASYENDQLIILFESEPEKPLKLAGKIDFGVYDPTFYTAIDFTEDDHMAVKDLPASCTRTVIRPDPDDAIAQNKGTLTDAFFNDPTGTDLSKIFATRLELNCQAEG